MAIVIIHGPFLCFSIFMIIFPSLTSSTTDIEALATLKQSFTNATALHSWRPGTEPCAGNGGWAGVTCEHGAVSELHLENLGLSGKIDVDALASLSLLRTVALTSNAFSGPLPDFHRLRPLKGLNVSDNQFSGEIPSGYFLDMGGLEKLWLSQNNFSGPIPSSLARLSQLMELHLENNRFSGMVPSFEQRSLISLNLSNNNLDGEIPPGLSKFSPGAFIGNLGLCEESSGRSCPNLPLKQKKPVAATLCMVAFFAVLLVMVIVMVMVTGCYLMRRRNKERAKENLGIMNPLGSISIKSVSSSRKGFMSIRHGGLEALKNEDTFDIGDLMRADAVNLGIGSLGSSYKATMPSGFTVVVKRMTEFIEKDKLDAEMRTFGRLNHKNVLTPLAYHYQTEEKLLVYEYQHTGSLMFLLHGDRGSSHANLNWPVRLNIIRGIARGLGYLHARDLLHGNLKSSNVLLTTDYNALLVDYGSCSLISQGQAEKTIMAYKSPEAILDHEISPKCDVYCLGIVILEILTGRFPDQYRNSQGGVDLVHWVRSAIGEGRERELLNPDIANGAGFVGEMGRVLRIGADCTEEEPVRRLELREAIRRIESDSCGANKSQTFHILPSLKDGIIGEKKRASGDHWRSGKDSVGDDSGRSFAFEIP